MVSIHKHSKFQAIALMYFPHNTWKSQIWPVSICQNGTKTRKMNRPWPRSSQFWRWSGYSRMPNFKPFFQYVLKKMSGNLSARTDADSTVPRGVWDGRRDGRTTPNIMSPSPKGGGTKWKFRKLHRTRVSWNIQLWLMAWIHSLCSHQLWQINSTDTSVEHTLSHCNGQNNTQRLGQGKWYQNTNNSCWLHIISNCNHSAFNRMMYNPHLCVNLTGAVWRRRLYSIHWKGKIVMPTSFSPLATPWQPPV